MAQKKDQNNSEAQVPMQLPQGEPNEIPAEIVKSISTHVAAHHNGQEQLPSLFTEEKNSFAITLNSLGKVFKGKDGRFSYKETIEYIVED